MMTERGLKGLWYGMRGGFEKEQTRFFPRILLIYRPSVFTEGHVTGAAFRHRQPALDPSIRL